MKILIELTPAQEQMLQVMAKYAFDVWSPGAQASSEEMEVVFLAGVQKMLERGFMESTQGGKSHG